MIPEGRPARVREILLRRTEDVGSDAVGIALSGGIDSQSVLYSLWESGRRPTCYSFTLDDRESLEFRTARETAARLGLPFVPVILPTDLEDLAVYVRGMVRRGYVRKTTVECCWPLLRLIRALREPVLASGWSTDAIFGLSKSAIINWRHRMDEYRARQRVEEFDPAGQWGVFTSALATKGARFFVPYGCDEMWEVFRGTTWEEINRPRQKEDLIRAWPEHFRHIRVRPRTNLHIGDSGIRDLFARLLETPLNARRRSDAGALYRDIARGDCPPWPGGDHENRGAWLGRLLPEGAR